MSDERTTGERLRAALIDDFALELKAAHSALDRLLAYTAAQARVEALQQAPCDSDWMMADEIDCIEAKRRHMKQPDDSWPLCVRCGLLTVAKAALAALGDEDA